MTFQKHSIEDNSGKDVLHNLMHRITKMFPGLLSVLAKQKELCVNQ